MNDNSPILGTKIKRSFFNRLYWISKSLSIWLDPEVSKRASGPLESFTGGFNDSIHFSTIKVKFSKWHHQNAAKKKSAKKRTIYYSWIQINARAKISIQTQKPSNNNQITYTVKLLKRRIGKDSNSNNETRRNHLEKTK